MKTKLKSLLFVVIFLLSRMVFAEVSYTLKVIDQQVSGSDFLFKIYLQSTGEDKLYLADSQIYLDFNEENFNSPTIAIEEKGSDLNLYSLSPSIDVNNRIAINIGKPAWGTQEEFEQRIAKVLTSGNGTYIGEFKISTISNFSGSAELAWYYQGTNATDIWYFDNSNPWFAHRITSYSNVDPEDHSLPIELSLFSAEVVYNYVLIRWTTESEIDNLGYNLYRSINEDRDYRKINNELIAGATNSTERSEYTFKDKNIESLKTYYYKLECISVNGLHEFYGPIFLTNDISNLNPNQFSLKQNYPNPFNIETEISYQIPQESKIKIEIFNLKGILVKTLIHKNQNIGYHSILWDGSDNYGKKVPSGIYFISIITEMNQNTKKIIYTK